MDLTSTRQGNSVFDELKMRIYNQKFLEESMAHHSVVGGELEEALDIIESDYNFNLFKVDEVAELESRDEQVRRKFLEQKMYVDSMDIGEKSKLQSILTTASILSRVNTRTQDLSLEEMYLLASSMVPLALEDYQIYGDVLSSPTLLRAILAKTKDTSEQLDICGQIIEYCDTFSSEGMTNLEYSKVCRDSAKIISQYQISSKDKIK